MQAGPDGFILAKFGDDVVALEYPNLMLTDVKKRPAAGKRPAAAPTGWYDEELAPEEAEAEQQKKEQKEEDADAEPGSAVSWPAPKQASQQTSVQ